MLKKSKGNLLVTFIMIVAFSIVVFSFLSFLSIKLKESGIRTSDVESFYVAEAGLNKAIWYLATPVASGGRGFSWRTTGTTEAYGWGSFVISVQNHSVSGEVNIISTGEVGGIHKTVSQRVRIGGLPAAFDYAVFCNNSMNLSGNAEVSGDMFVNGNTNFTGNATVSDGMIFHPSGTTLTGHGTFTDGGEPNPIPTFPAFDPSYYDGLIAAAGGFAAENQSYSNTTIDLNGGTVYVHGNVTISGNTTFNGPGVIVATGTVAMSGNTYSTSSVKFISGGAQNLTGNSYTSGSVFYSSTSLTASGNTRVDVGGFLTKGALTLSGNMNISGIVYSEGGVSLSGNPVISGSLVTSSVAGIAGISGNGKVTFDPTKFPATPPPGFESTELTRLKGTWRGE